jgi:hypothetical protein
LKSLKQNKTKQKVRRHGLRFEDKIKIRKWEGMNWICLAQVRLKMVGCLGCCEDGNEPSAAIKGKEFYERLKDSTLW